MNKLYCAVLTCLVTAFIICGCAGPGAGADKVPHGPAKDFSLKDLNNQTVTLANFKDKIVIINFWATWCPPCQKEIPDLISLYKTYQGQGVVVVGIAIDEEGSKVVNPFVEEYKMNYPVLLGNEQVVSDYGGMAAVPTSFLMDKSGNIYKYYMGYHSIGDFQKDLDALLNSTR